LTGPPSEITPEIVRLLIQHGADPTIQNNKGGTAYSMLEWNWEHRHGSHKMYREILKLLDSYEDIKEPDLRCFSSL
jgi:hypothetical protein